MGYSVQYHGEGYAEERRQESQYREEKVRVDKSLEQNSANTSYAAASRTTFSAHDSNMEKSTILDRNKILLALV